MTREAWLILILVLMLVLGVILRRRFLAPETPFRQWWDARVAPTARKVMTVVFCITVAAWLAIWATASPEDRTRLGIDMKSFFKSIEWKAPAPGETGK